MAGGVYHGQHVVVGPYHSRRVLSGCPTPTIHIEHIGITRNRACIERTAKHVHTHIVGARVGLQCPGCVAASGEQIGVASVGRKVEIRRNLLSLLQRHGAFIDIGRACFQMQLLATEADGWRNGIAIDHHFVVGEEQRLATSRHFDARTRARCEVGLDGKGATCCEREALCRIIGGRLHNVLAVPKDVTLLGTALHAEHTCGRLSPHPHVGVVAFGCCPGVVAIVLTFEALHTHLVFLGRNLAILPVSRDGAQEIVAIGGR